jgi:hypothetical protein
VFHRPLARLHKRHRVRSAIRRTLTPSEAGWPPSANSTRIADEHGRAEAAERQRKSSHPIQQELQLSRLVGVGPPHEKKIQFLQGATAAGKAVNVKAPRFREQDIPVAITTLIQVLVVQLIDLEVLTVEQAEQVFDGAAKRSGRLKDTAPDAERVIQHLHDGLNWDQYYKLAADRRRYRQQRD